MDDISVKINDDANKIEIEVDKIDVDKIDFDEIEVDKNDVHKNNDEIFTFDNKLHNGNPITRIEISTNEDYLITYSKEDGSIVGWNVEDIDKVQLKFDQTVKINESIYSLCVSDEKFIFNNKNGTHNVLDMNNKDKRIALSFDVDKNKFKTKNIGIFSNEKFIFLKINYKIIVYSNELGIPIASLDINNDIQLYKFMNHTGSFLLPSLFYYTPDKEIKYCWNSKYKNMFNQTLFDEPIDKQTGFVFGIQNRHVWKSKLDEKMSKLNLPSKNSDELNKENNKIIECDDDDKYLNVPSFNLYMDAVSTLLQKITTNGESAEYKIFNELTESTEHLIKWNIRIGDSKINLEVFKKGKLINMRIENFHYPYKAHINDNISNFHYLIASSLFNNNDIVILTTFEENIWKCFNISKEYFQNLPYHYQIMIVLD
ncbi:hypothetical protein GLOIN_2v1767492 [Rhizophagus irregularis DAOM 181602=DAOM 197198]|nr:hypothetical protein GLOIN_2v1767492 [Rhizophagus irregularis DAOM 181602=DAOM 197198]